MLINVSIGFKHSWQRSFNTIEGKKEPNIDLLGLTYSYTANIDFFCLFSKQHPNSGISCLCLFIKARDDDGGDDADDLGEPCIISTASLRVNRLHSAILMIVNLNVFQSLAFHA